MTKPDESVDCPSQEPNGRFFQRLFKKMLWNLADEGTKSIGRYAIFGIIAIVILTYIGGIVDSFTGFFGGWFDWLPFIGSESAPETAPPPVVKQTPSEPGAICSRTANWNPFCD